MERHVSETGTIAYKPNYFCYKAYIKGTGYALFSIYLATGIRRLRQHISEYSLQERCPSCQHFGGNMVEMASLCVCFSIYGGDVNDYSNYCIKCHTVEMFWEAFDVLMYVIAPFSALIALIYADLEWFFPAYAVQLHFPSFMLIAPAVYSIFSYIIYWLIDLIINMQQISEELSDMVVWKRCISSSALLVANIYGLLLAALVMLLTYSQHSIIIEDQLMLQQRDGVNAVNVVRPVVPRNQPVHAIIASQQNQQVGNAQGHTDNT